MNELLIPNPNLAPFGPTVFKTERNQREVRCDMCNRIIYVAPEIFSCEDEEIEDAFMCEVCKERVALRAQ